MLGLPPFFSSSPFLFLPSYNIRHSLFNHFSPTIVTNSHHSSLPLIPTTSPLSVYYHHNGQMVEIFEIAAVDNLRKSILREPVPLSAGSQLEWVGYDVTLGEWSHCI